MMAALTGRRGEIRTSPRADCFLCGAEGVVLHEGLRDHLFGAPGTWSLRRCPAPDCGMVWLDPLPDPRDIGLLYESYYTHSGSCQNYLASQRRTLRSAAALARSMGLVRHSTTSAMIAARMRPGRDLLEVGCGRGEFLDEMRRQGRRVTGVDIDGAACDHARSRFGLDVRHGTLADAGLDGGSYDTVVMNHVIEHVHDPAGLLRECRRVLRPGGALVMITPNHESVGHRLFRDHWRGLEPPRHLHLFSRRTATSLARQARFADVRVDAVPDHAFFFFSKSAAIRSSTGAAGGGRLARFMQSLMLQYYEQLACRGDRSAGEELLMTCRRAATS